MTKKITCTSAEELLNELLSEGHYSRDPKDDSSKETFLEIVQLEAYDSDDLPNKPIASAEIICGRDTGVPYCMCFTKESRVTNINKVFNPVFDAILKELANYPPRIKSNTR